MFNGLLFRSSIVLVVLCCCALHRAAAQDTTAAPRKPLQPPKHVFWAGSPLRSAKNWSVGYHWRFRPAYALELRASIFQHNDPSELELFNGVLNNKYFTIAYSEKRNYPPYKVEKFSLLEFGYPLRKIQEIVPVSTNQFLLGWKFLLQKPNSRFFASLMPSFAVTQHYFFKVQQSVVYYEEVKRELAPGPGYEILKTTTKTNFTDQRMMTQHWTWHVGMAYDIGLGYQIHRNVLVEGRFGGVFVPEGPYEAPLPVPVKPLQMAYWLRVGVGF